MCSQYKDVNFNLVQYHILDCPMKKEHLVFQSENGNFWWSFTKRMGGERIICVLKVFCRVCAILEPANIFTLVWGKSAKYWSKNSCRTSLHQTWRRAPLESQNLGDKASCDVQSAFINILGVKGTWPNYGQVVCFWNFQDFKWTQNRIIILMPTEIDENMFFMP